ncbi:MAG: glycosyltransferase [Rhodobacteraceae bacterium]|jgi:hypothetical protein|nr:glycosyltransferase [Paracoccaceae bacterium]
MPHALIISPVRSWPLDQGNRVRVLAMGTMLRERGFGVHFLLSHLEGGPNAAERAVMDAQWDLVRHVPYRHQRPQAHAEAFGADDWYDPALDAAVADLCAAWDYDLCLVNYAWFSRALEALPPGVVRIIDTHDAFGDRHKRLHAAGTNPTWYYTRPQDEGLCLDRADLVIAIQDEEQRWFEGLTACPVRTVGHVLAPAFLPPRPRAGGRWRVGYLASGNPSNQLSVAALMAHWAADPVLLRDAELHVAGPICEVIPDGWPFVVKRGFVPDQAGFYAGVDIAVNPNVGGSGLKIKSVEALAFGRPLFATAEGMLGICDVAPPYVSPDVAGLVRAMGVALSQDPDLAAATAWARATFLAYRDRHIAAFDALLAEAAALRAATDATGVAA